MTEKKRPTVLIYRRTHTGDPDKKGVFGCNGCMGSVRSWDYDAVIGIGGIRPWAGDEGIARKVNWIGIGPKREPVNSDNPLVSFSKFISWDEKGPFLIDCAPELYKYMFEQGHIPRTGKSFPDDIYKEILDLLDLADTAPPSQGELGDIKSNSSCKPQQPTVKMVKSCS